MERIMTESTSREELEQLLNKIGNHSEEFLNPWYFKTSVPHEDLATAFVAIKDRLRPAIQSHTAREIEKARREELLEIGLLAHKFEGEDYHCREIADAIDERLGQLTANGEVKD